MIAMLLAAMASDDSVRYSPTGRSVKVGRSRWYEMTAESLTDDRSWVYFLRREAGSYVGGYPAGV